VFCEFASCHKIVVSPKIVLYDCPKIVCEFGPRFLLTRTNSPMTRDMSCRLLSPSSSLFSVTMRTITVWHSAVMWTFAVTADYAQHRVCLKRANAKVSSIGCYPQVLALSAYSNLQVDHLSTTKPPDISNLTDLVHYGYSHHLYVLPLGCSPFSHLIHPNPNPNCDPNLTLTLTNHN